MQQRDLLKDQIEQLGRVLGKAIAIITGSAAGANPVEILNIANDQLREELGFEIEDLLPLEDEALTDYLTDKGFDPEKLELLADYFYAAGRILATTEETTAHVYLQKALQLLVIVEETTGTFSFERMEKAREIEDRSERLQE